MSSRFRGKSKITGLFTPLPKVYFCTPQFNSLTPAAKALLIHLALKFDLHNNGNLEMTEKQAQALGFGSGKTFRRTRDELLRTGWLVRTRRGGLEHRPTLYALTHLPIDATGKQYDHPWRADQMPLHLWKPENTTKRDWSPEEAATRPTRPNRLDSLIQNHATGR